MINKRTGHVMVLGFGASGIAATRLLLDRGWSVTVVDERADLSDSLTAHDFHADAVTTVRDVRSVSVTQFDAAIVSPGIRREHSWLAELHAADIPVIPEFELGLSYLTDTKVIAITGSNGKSSLVKWITDALKQSGCNAVAAGNYGLPPCAIAAAGHMPEVIVLELSSFQLEQCAAFKPDIAVLLNLSPNHLDRHATYEDYKAAKVNVFNRMGKDGTVWIHAPAWEQIKDDYPAECTPLFFDDGEGGDAGYSNGWVYLDGQKAVELTGTWWSAYPQSVNASAGVAILRQLGLETDTIRKSAESFEPLPHRSETFVVYNGITFIDDSKASTMSALRASVQSGDAKKHLIAGGILKESDVSFVKEILVENCAFVYCIGTVAEKLVGAWKDCVPCEDCGDLETAVRLIFTKVKSGEVVLLSPGCSSFDQFSSYAQRGQKFKELVHRCISRSRGDEITMQGVNT